MCFLSQRRRITNAEKEKEESEGWSTIIFLWRHWEWKWWRWFWESYAPSNPSMVLLFYCFLTSFMDICLSYLFTFFGTICGLLHWTRFFLCFTISLLVCGDYCLSFHISFASIVRIIWWLILNVHMYIICSCTCFRLPIIAYCAVAFKFYKLFGEVLSWWFRPMRTLVLHFFLSQYWVWKLTSVGVVFF